MGWNLRRDANERAIVDALRQTGAVVFQVSGDGVPDLFVFARGVWVPMEVKRPKGRSTKSQLDWLAKGIPIFRIETVDDALKAIGAVR